jgi:hypothetical protein
VKKKIENYEKKVRYKCEYVLKIKKKSQQITNLKRLVNTTNNKTSRKNT